jgi:hypothetical protein
MPFLITGIDKSTKKPVKSVSRAQNEALARKSAEALGIEIETILAVAESSSEAAEQVRQKPIVAQMGQMTTDELLSIWVKNDRTEWSDAAFDAISFVLGERGISVPKQNAPVLMQTNASSAQDGAVGGRRPIPYAKARRLDLCFREWGVVLSLWVVCGFFWLCKEYTDYDGYCKAVANISMASSPYYTVKPEFANAVKRLSAHIDQLERLETVFAASGIASLACWIATIFVRRQIQQKSPSGPKMLLWLLCGMLAFDIIFALCTIDIPRSEVRDLIDLDQLRVQPLALLVLILAVLPFFSKWAPTYYVYVSRDNGVFSRIGAAWQFIDPQEIPRRVAKLNSRRRRSGYAAWAYVISIAAVIVGLLVTKGNLPPKAAMIGLIAVGLIVLWTIVECTLLSSEVSASDVAIFVGGFLTVGIASFIAILFLRRKALKELAMAPDQAIEVSAVGS